MSQPATDGEAELELERYELRAPLPYHFDLDRRDFFRVLGGGIVVAFRVTEALGQESGGGRRRNPGGPGSQMISAWLHIGEDGVVTVYTGKVEIGQNIRTSLSQAVSEELRAPITSVKVVMADTDLTPYDAGTFGSQTTPVMSRQLRKVAAAAREMLIDLAAETLKTDRSLLSASDGKVLRSDTKEAVSYGVLTKGQKLAKSITEDARTTSPDQWKVAGQSIKKVNGRDLVTGRHQYSPDIHLPGMLHGKILRPESFGATLTSIDTKEAEAIPGVTVVRDGNFVGVTASDDFIASNALETIKAEWKSTPQISGSELYEHLKKSDGNARGGRGGGNHLAGSMEEGLRSADIQLKQSYTVAYIAHAPLEPRAAVAQWEGNKLTVWTGTQRPFGVREELMNTFHLSEANVRVITPDTGSGYGGKHTGEAAVEAARLARAVKKPVKLVWTREEEFTWAYFRPAGVIEVASGVKKDGTLTAWEFHNYNSGASAIRTLYEAPNQRIEFHGSQSPLRQGSYRGLAATANHFARETHMDELAHAIQMDPLEFRLKNLKDERLRAVLQAAAEAFGWGKSSKEKNHGFGIAGGSEKGSFLATCAEVKVDPSNGQVKVIRAVSAFECGTVMNPDQLKNQVEGAMIMGLGGALFEAIQFGNGKISNPHFSRYRVPRFADIPKIEVVLINRKDLPSAGAGETPIVCIAPAIGNAIFEATGTRLRSMPLAPKGVKA